MKSRILTCFIAIALFAALSFPVQTAAQDKKSNQHHHYQLIDLGTLGGPQSYLAGSNAVTSPGGVNQVLNNKGTVVGWADTSILDPYAPFCSNPFPNGDCFLVNAFQWQNGVLTDLGGLPDGDASDARWISDTGLIAGESRNGLLDPLVPGLPEVHAVLWKNGEAIDLGTLGGNESSALSVNDRGQVVGFATNTIPEPLPFSLFGTQGRAFLWQDGAMRDLGTLGSGNDSFSEFVNERGQVTGWSFINTTINPTTGLPTFEPFLWEHGTMQDLGTLGGTMGFPYGLNIVGQVIGASNLPGDPGCLQPPDFFCQTHPFLWDRGVLKDLGTFGGNFGFALGINDSGEVVGWATSENDQAELAFFWRDGVMTNLGTLNGDDCSAAFQINSRGQIVGISFPCAGGPLRGFIWQNGFMTDLNALLPSGSSLTPEGDGATINDRGEIAEMGVLPDGDIHAFLLIPCDEHHPGFEGCDYSMVDAKAVQSTAAAVHKALGPNPQPLGRRMMPWPRGLGAQPPARTLISRPPVSTASARFSADTVTDDLLGDHTLAPSRRPPLLHHGECEVNEFGKLTGSCLALLPPYYFCSIKPSNGCPKGAKSRHTSVTPCLGVPDRVDATRRCSF